MIAIATETQPFDDDRKFINVHEGFRKAKRNSLLWSAILLLAAAASTDDGEVKAALFSATYPIWLIIIGALFAALFMVVAFWREDKTLTAANSQFHRDKSAYDLTVAYRNLKLDAEERGRKIAEIAKTLVSSEERIQKSAHRFADCWIAFSNIERRLKSGETVVRGKNGGLATDIDVAIADVKAMLENERAQIERDKPIVEETPKLIADQLEGLDGVARQMTLLHEGIANRDRWFLYIHDRAAVYGLFAIATIAATLHLIAYFWPTEFPILAATFDIARS